MANTGSKFNGLCDSLESKWRDRESRGLVAIDADDATALAKAMHEDQLHASLAAMTPMQKLQIQADALRLQVGLLDVHTKVLSMRMSAFGMLEGRRAGVHVDKAGRSLVEKYIIATPVSDSFRAEVDRGIASIPANILDFAAAKGGRIVIGDRVANMVPEVSGGPSGWGDGVYDEVRKQAVVAEEKTGTTGLVLKNTRVPEVLRHEFGHAIDHLTKCFSRHPEFATVYEAEAKAAKAADALKYFTHAGKANGGEAFAEGFAILYGGGAARNDVLFRKFFPRTMGVIREHVEKLRP